MAASSTPSRSASESASLAGLPPDVGGAVSEAALTREEARNLTDEVKRDGERLWAKVRELHDRRAHEALKYASWHAYCEAEFGFKQAQAYRLLHAGQVAAIIPRDNEAPRPNERQARELAPLLKQPEQVREAWAEVVALHPEPTAADVREVVTRRQLTTQTLGSSESDEWYTPGEYVDAARRVLGGIDLDPASCEAANAVVKADRFYSLSDDGLGLPWRGRLFMNPPFGRHGSPLFVAKMLDEYAAGNVRAAVILCAARLETQWFQPLFDHLLCFPHHRVRFWQPGRVPAPPFTPAFAYLGADEDVFAHEFGRFGAVVSRVDGRTA